MAVQHLRQNARASAGGRFTRLGHLCVVATVIAALAGWQAFAGGTAGLAAQEQSTWSGVYTGAQASRGETLYNSSCAVCHGDDLAGSEMGPGLAGSSFLNFWEGLSLGDLYQVMSVSMPQDNPGSLDTAEYVDLIAYMLQESEMPAGDGELSEDALGGITIQAEAQ